MVVKMGRHVTSQIAFKSLAVGGWGGPSLIIMPLCGPILQAEIDKIFSQTEIPRLALSWNQNRFYSSIFKISISGALPFIRMIYDGDLC